MSRRAAIRAWWKSNWWVVAGVVWPALLVGQFLYFQNRTANNGDTHPITYLNDPVPIIDGPFHVGDTTVTTHVHRCSTLDHSVLISFDRVLVREGGGTVYVPSVVAEFPVGCVDSDSKVDIIPKGIAPGRYYLRALGTFSAGGRALQVDLTTQIFEVLP